MSSDLNTLAREDSRPGLEAARRVAEDEKLLDSDKGREHFAFYDDDSDTVAVFEYDGWEGLLREDIDIYGNQLWSAPRSELVDGPASTTD